MDSCLECKDFKPNRRWMDGTFQAEETAMAGGLARVLPGEAALLARNSLGTHPKGRIWIPVHISRRGFVLRTLLDSAILFTSPNVTLVV